MKINFKKLFKVTASCLLTCCFTLSVGFLPGEKALAATPPPAASVPEEEGGKPVVPSYDDIIYYKWTRFDGTTSIAEFLGKDTNKPTPGIIVYENKGVKRYLSGACAWEWDDVEDLEIGNLTPKVMANDNQMALDGEPFITADLRNAFFFWYAGDDDSNGNQPKYNLAYPDSSGIKPGLSLLSGNTDERDAFQIITDYRYPNDDIEPWTFTSDAGHKVPSGHVKIFNNIPGWTDQWMAYDKVNDKFFSNYNGNWENLENYQIYKAEPINYTTINYNFVVQKGQTFNVKDNSMLLSSYVLTVEKDAVLSIDGQFYNNGLIRNYGTIIIQPNSAMSPFGRAGSNAGSVENIGGDIVMLNDAKLYINENSKLTLKDGATLVNAGTIIVAGGMNITNSTLDVRANGNVFLGMTVDQNIAHIKSVKVWRSDTSATFLYQGYMRASPSKYSTLADAEKYGTVLGPNARILNNGRICISQMVISYSDFPQFFRGLNGREDISSLTYDYNAFFEVYTNPQFMYLNAMQQASVAQSLIRSTKIEGRYWAYAVAK